jgi:hypothetical protein
MPLFAKPQNHSSWIYAVAKLAEFEKAHLVNDPELGRVIRLNTPAEIELYQELLDAELTSFAERTGENIATTTLHVVQ